MEKKDNIKNSPDRKGTIEDCNICLHCMSADNSSAVYD